MARGLPIQVLHVYFVSVGSRVHVTVWRCRQDNPGGDWIVAAYRYGHVY